MQITAMLLGLHNNAPTDSAHVKIVLMHIFVEMQQPKVCFIYIYHDTDKNSNAARSTFPSHHISPCEPILFDLWTQKIPMDTAIYVEMPSIIFFEIGFTSLEMGGVIT